MEQPSDFIQHTTTTKLNLKDRLRVLLGASVVVNSNIATEEIVTVLFSTAHDSVEGGVIDKIKKLWKR